MLDDVRGDHIVERCIFPNDVVDRSGVRHVVDRHDCLDVEAVVRCIASSQRVGVDVVEVADVSHLASHDGVGQRAELQTLPVSDVD